MSRGVGVLAWVVATILSVAASTAAVATVRDQVTDGPNVVSLATLRRAAATTTTVVASDADLVRETVATAPSTTTTTSTPPTTRPSPSATPGTTVEVIPPTAPEPVDGSTSEEPSEGDVITRTLRGGTVSISFDGQSIRLVDAIAEDPYVVSVETETDRRIVVRFVLDGRSSALTAEVLEGELRIKTFD
jgi:hypothetical protein